MIPEAPVRWLLEAAIVLGEDAEAVIVAALLAFNAVMRCNGLAARFDRLESRECAPPHRPP